MANASTAEIYLLRHGETEWNVAGRFQGKLDSCLTRNGEEQARACGRKLASIVDRVDAVFASPLGRVRQTVEIIQTYGDYPETRWDDRLSEVSLGSWDGLTHEDIDASWPDQLNGTTRYDWYFQSPDGETFTSATTRVRDWLGGLDGAVVAVAHGLLGRIIRGVYLGMPKEEMLQLPVRHDVIWRMARGEIKAIEVES